MLESLTQIPHKHIDLNLNSTKVESHPISPLRHSFLLHNYFNIPASVCHITPIALQLCKDPESGNHKLDPIPKPSFACCWKKNKEKKKKKSLKASTSFGFFPVMVHLMMIMTVDADVHAQDDDRNIIDYEITTSYKEPSCGCSAGWNYMYNFHMMSKMKALVREACVPSLL